MQLATTQPEKNVQEVREYDLFLDVDFTGLKYSGKVVVDLESVGDVSLEAVQARKVLPCVDHPAYKAVFKVRVRTNADLSVISNMPIESETTQGEKKTFTFKKTPKMSTYLLYLGVGKFIQEKSRHGGTE